eukprot:TRINITY_DN6229_c0_g1_i1.p1 TRINITY_DN6229_c0_g1~~TRINITY_DN6229_c0_g1_i1.p1  ORF type:complete len:134 (-),score=1.29 TRINITY_DN6229_c0_g1_i1:116-517(-)
MGVETSLACAFALLLFVLRLIIQSVVGTIFLSLRTLFLYISPPINPKRKSGLCANVTPVECSESLLYEGTVRHIRRRPVKHAFSYPVRFAVVDLENVPGWFARSSAKHHLTPGKVREISGTTGSVYPFRVHLG